MNTTTLKARLRLIKVHLETEAAKEYDADWRTTGGKVLRDPHSGKFAKKGTAETDPVAPVLPNSSTVEELHQTQVEPTVPGDPLAPELLGQLADALGNLDAGRQKLVRDFIQDEDIGRVTANTLRLLGFSDAQIAEAAKFIAPGIKAGESIAAYFKRFLDAEIKFIQGMIEDSTQDKPELIGKLGQYASAMVPIAAMIVLAVGPEVALGALAGQSLGAILANTALVQGSLYAAHKGLDMAGVHNPYLRGAMDIWVGTKTGSLLLQKNPTLVSPGDFAEANVEAMLTKARSQAEQTQAITDAVRQQMISTGQGLTREQARARDVFIDSLYTAGAAAENPGVKDFLYAAADMAAVAKSKAVAVSGEISPDLTTAIEKLPIAPVARSLISTKNLRAWVEKELRTLSPNSAIGKELASAGVDPKLIASRLSEMTDVDRLAIAARQTRVRDVDRLVSRIQELPAARQRFAEGTAMLEKAQAAREELAQLQADLPNLAKRHPLGTKEAWELAQRVRNLEIQARFLEHGGRDLQAELGFRTDILNSEILHGRQLDRFLYESRSPSSRQVNYEAFLKNIQQHRQANVAVETASQDEAEAIAMLYGSPAAKKAAGAPIASYDERLRRVTRDVEEFSKYTNANRPIKVGAVASRGFQADPAQFGSPHLPPYLDAGVDAQTSVTWHELGHATAMGSGSLKRELAFRESRRKSPFDLPLKGFPDEVAIDDEFTNPYTGKRYATDNNPLQDNATEITSTGVEALSKGAMLHKTGLNDREHLMFTLGTMRRPVAESLGGGGTAAFSSYTPDEIKEAIAPLLRENESILPHPDITSYSIEELEDLIRKAERAGKKNLKDLLESRLTKQVWDLEKETKSADIPPSKFEQERLRDAQMTLRRVENPDDVEAFGAELEGLERRKLRQLTPEVREKTQKEIDEKIAQQKLDIVIRKNLQKESGFSVTTDARGNTEIESPELNDLRRLKQEYVKGGNQDRADEVQRVIDARKAVIVSTVGEASAKFFSKTTTVQPGQDFAQKNLGNKWDKLLHEQFPERSLDDASWVAKEEDGVAELQSQMIKQRNFYIDTEDAQKMVSALKSDYARTGSLNWADVESNVVTYYRLSPERSPTMLNQPGSYPEQAVEGTPSTARTPKPLGKEEAEQQKRNFPEINFANYVLKDFGFSLSNSEARTILEDLTGQGFRLKPPTATPTTFLGKTVDMPPSEAELREALSSHKKEVEDSIALYFRFQGRGIPRPIRTVGTLPDQRTAVSNKWGRDVWLNVIETNRAFAVKQFEKEHGVNLYDLFDPEVVKEGGGQLISNASLATFMANYRKTSNREGYGLIKHVIVAPGEFADGDWHVPEMKATMPGDYEPLQEYIDRIIPSGQEAIAFLSEKDLANGQGLRLLSGGDSPAEQARQMAEGKTWTLDPVSVSNPSQIPTSKADLKTKPKRARPYQEAVGSSFTHDGKIYDLNKALDLVAKKPVEQVNVSDMEWVLPFTEVDPARQAAADLNAPLLVHRRQGQTVAVDGAHRLAKAKAEGQNSLPARVITDQELAQSELKPTVAKPPPKTIKGFRQNLRQMFLEDQNARRAAVTAPSDQQRRVRLDDLEAKHTQALKSFVNRYGWPNKNDIGDDAAHHAATLLQHSNDLDFQKNVLQQMKVMRQESSTSVDPRQIAELEDRIRLAEGEPQLYGTQVNWNKASGDFEFEGKIEDMQRLDQRRKSLGLNRIRDYIETFAPPAED